MAPWQVGNLRAAVGLSSRTVTRATAPALSATGILPAGGLAHHGALELRLLSEEADAVLL
jgi:hypothetical protein